MKYFGILLLWFGCCLLYQTHGNQSFLENHLQTDDETQALAARGVASRLLGEKVSFFNITVSQSIAVSGRDTFQLHKDLTKDLVHVIGSSGVAACWGLHHYLKHYCNCHISWDGDQLAVPHPLPNISISVSAVDKYRYYQNGVAASYSFVWWEWGRWQREIDWMALNGINMALAFTGQEAIWQQVYLKLNLTQKEIDGYFCGPAFLSWCRTGNLVGWGGPLPQSWHRRTVQLQLLILSHMRKLGIMPVLPAFTGHVPKAFKRIFPDANMTRVEPWKNFVDQYCCPLFVNPSDPLFNQIGYMFMEELKQNFGTNQFYNCDPYYEQLPLSSDENYLNNVSKAIFKVMKDADPSAVWVMQSWFVGSSSSFWTPAKTKAFLSGVPIGELIILDLQSEAQNRNLDSYFGHNFIWCLLQNFGGSQGFYGSVDNLNMGIFNSRMQDSMIGIGLAPEGINQNYVVYDLVLDMLWRLKPVNLTSWFSYYATRRYGANSSYADSGWQLLKSGIYNFTGKSQSIGKCILCQEPNLQLESSFWYDTTGLQLAWRNFVYAIPDISDSSLFQHDLVDITRQALQILAEGFYNNAKQAFLKNDSYSFKKNSDQFLFLLFDLDNLLSTDEGFLFGSWLKAAKNLATNDTERLIFEFNARNQITLWGPLGENNDYATKQWSGLVLDYYEPRWTLFFNFLMNVLLTNVTYDESSFRATAFMKIERPFTLADDSFPYLPIGDRISQSKSLFDTWGHHEVWEELKQHENLD